VSQRSVAGTSRASRSTSPPLETPRAGAAPGRARLRGATRWFAACDLAPSANRPARPGPAAPRDPHRYRPCDLPPTRGSTATRRTLRRRLARLAASRPTSLTSRDHPGFPREPLPPLVGAPTVGVPSARHRRSCGVCASRARDRRFRFGIVEQKRPSSRGALTLPFHRGSDRPRRADYRFPWSWLPQSSKRRRSRTVPFVTERHC
jgi:hypothetical protein